MKAFALVKKGETAWIDVPVPECGPLDAICRPIALAPCTSDVHSIENPPSTYKPNAILGHEALGQIVKVGELVHDFKVGDRVIISALTPSWGDVMSQEGYPMHCGGTNNKYTSNKYGVFAEYINVNEADSNLAHLPDDVPPEAAIMIVDMITTGLHGCELAEVRFGDVVAVIGIGPVGLMSIAGAVHMGASRIFAVGSRPNCVALAKEFGATDIISYKGDSIAKQIMTLTGGKGVDKVIIAGGTNNTMVDAVAMCKTGGKIGNVVYFTEGDVIPIPRLYWYMGMGHKDIRGGMCPGGRARIERILNLIKYKRIDPIKLCSHKFEGLESISDALKLMAEKPADLIKPVVLIHYND